MLRCERIKQSGAILILTLIFLFVLTLLTLSESEDIIMNQKMASVLRQDFKTYERADMGIGQLVLRFEGIAIQLPSSPISLKTKATLENTDNCGNQTYLLESIAADENETIILNSEDIFAKVPTAKKCKKIPIHRVLWWHMTN